MKRIVLFLCVLVFSIFSNTNNLLAKEIENNIKENISNEVEEIKPDNKKYLNYYLENYSIPINNIIGIYLFHNPKLDLNKK